MIFRFLPPALALLAGVHAGEIRDRIDPETLRARQGQANPFAALTRPEPTETPTRKAEPRGVVGRSILLSNGKSWTLVPPGSVIHVPENLAHHIVEAPTGELLGWREFLARNRGWLSTEDVDPAVAAGTRPLPEATATALSKRGTVVVAVHQGGAISLAAPSPTPES